VPFN